MNQSVAPVIEMAAHRRAPQPPSPRPVPPVTDETPAYVSRMYESGMYEGARLRDEQWIEFLGPLARNLNLAAFLTLGPAS